MAKCSRCGARFNREEAEDRFGFEHPDLNYEHFRGTFCGNCACEVIENEESGYYFETCDRCRKKFDLFADETDFMMRNWEYDGSLRDAWSEFHYLLCADCASDNVADRYGKL